MRACAINTFCGDEDPQPHLTDHLAPICVLLDIPLILTDFDHWKWVVDHYPDLEVHYYEPTQLDFAFYMENYEYLFRSLIWDMRIVWDRLAPLEKHFGRRLRTVHCPHGLSDKVYWFEKMAHEDIILSYGDGMNRLLRERGVLDTVTGCVTTGNLRWDYYQTNQEFFDEAVDREVFRQFEHSQRTLLYAPTWMDGANASSFFEATDPLLSGLPEDWNLLVKLHPRQEDADPRGFRELVQRYNDRPNVVFLEGYPLVYPLLSRCDAYLGDMSSVGYDFLAFDRPMYFLNTQGWEVGTDPRTTLFQCGVTVEKAELSTFWKWVGEEKSSEDLSEKRRRLWRESFAASISKENFKQALALASGGRI